MKRGFTLIEILVVVSIISMLSSIVVASVAPAREKARDSVRTQQVKQIDLAIELYKAKEGHVPFLASPGCSVQNAVTAYSDVISGCVAISTQGFGGPGNATPWGRLQEDLSPYISSLPVDSCDSGCDSGSDWPLAYTYIAPAALEYFCEWDDSCDEAGITDESYQLYSPLEQNDDIIGNEGDGSEDIYYPPITDIMPPSTPGNFSSFLSGSPGSLAVNFSWGSSIDTGWSGLAGYNLHIRQENGTETSVFTTATSLQVTGSNDLPPGTSVCFWVTAIDNANNESEPTSTECTYVAVPPQHY